MFVCVMWIVLTADYEELLAEWNMTRAKTTKTPTRRTSREGVTFQTVREIAQTLAGAEESTSYGTPAFKLKGKLFVRQHQDGESLVIPIDFGAREELMNTSPDNFYLTDHYLNGEYVLVRMANVTADELRDLLTGAWRRVGGKKLFT